ncbi:MAG: hypothetical protein OEZ06_10685 [Myxococcales bacterium]|nr:hypothetical protein [Myxococcales bacterium]
MPQPEFPIPSQLRMLAPGASSTAGEREVAAGGHGPRFEQRIVETICLPLLAHVPERVHPNAISLTTHVIAWLTAGLAVLSLELEGPARSLTLLGAAAGTLLSMIGDCLEVFQGQRSGRRDRRSVLLGRWLDAVIVPLTALTVTVALDLAAPWVVLVGLTATMIYHGQLLLEHQSGRFVAPEPATGIEARFGISLGFAAVAVLLLWVDASARWLQLAFSLVALAAVVIQLRCNLFYYRKLEAWLRPHLGFVALGLSLGALYLAGAIDRIGFAITLTFCSFRICGSYALASAVGRAYDGRDRGLWLLLAVAALATLGSSPWPQLASVPPVCGNLLCLYALYRNVAEFARDTRSPSAQP